MDKFDQWYNKKMDEQEVAYSESSWESISQQLSQLPDTRKRRRPFLFIWLLALCIVAGAGSVFVWQAYTTPAAQEIQTSTAVDKVTAPASSENKSEAGSKDKHSQPLAAKVLPDSPESSIESEPVSSGKYSGIKREKERINTSGAHAGTGSFPGHSDAAEKDKVAFSRRSSNKNSGNSRNDSKSISDSQLALHTVPSSENSSNTSGLTEEIEKAEEMIAIKNEPAISTQAIEETEIFTGNEVNIQVISPLAVALKDLELQDIVLSQPSFLTNDLSSLKPTIVECCPYKGWTHHIELGAQFFPGVNEGSRFFTGLQAAYHLQYRWAKQWSASAGAGVLQRWGSFGGFQDSPQDIYTTTKVRRGFLLAPTSATYVQIPTMINFHVGKHIIGAGVRTLFLAGVQGQLDEYLLQRNEDEAMFSFNSNTVNTGWINESGFRSIVPEYMLSYSFQFNNHLSVSISGAWMPNGIVFAEKTNENLDILSSLVADSGSRQQPYLLEDKWQVGISLRYKF